MRRNHELRRLKPEGLWRAPLSDEQVAQALHFGTTVADQGKFAIHDVFLIEHSPKLQATISISTVFERLAVYASQQSNRAEPLDSTLVDIIRHNPIFETHYALDTTSPHKLLSIMRFYPGKTENMVLIEQQQLGKQSYRQVAGFPYRDVDYSTEGSSIRSPLIGWSEQFEVSVQKLFSKAMIEVIVDLRNYH